MHLALAEVCAPRMRSNTRYQKQYLVGAKLIKADVFDLEGGRECVGDIQHGIHGSSGRRAV